MEGHAIKAARRSRFRQVVVTLIHMKNEEWLSSGGKAGRLLDYGVTTT